MQLIYFARIREIIGVSEEERPLNEQIKTIGDLLDFLSLQDEKYSCAFQDLNAIRIAVNQNYVSFDHKITDQDEIAIFPPMTGG